MANLIVKGNGWLTPNGEFIRCEPASPIHLHGMAHTGHSKAILEWIDIHRQDLAEEVERLIPIDGDIVDVPRQTVIDLMVKHGFVRIVDEGETLRYEGNLNPIPAAILENSTKQRRQTLRELRGQSSLLTQAHERSALLSVNSYPLSAQTETGRIVKSQPI